MKAKKVEHSRNPIQHLISCKLGAKFILTISKTKTFDLIKTWNFVFCNFNLKIKFTDLELMLTELQIL